MHRDHRTTCPRCGQRMDQGFASSQVGLSWITPAQLTNVAFVDRDLNRRGLRKYLPIAAAAYFLSYHCASCKLYFVDYSQAVSRATATALAADM